MYRIDNATAVPASSGMPAPAGPGPRPNGYFTRGNPVTPVPATIVDDDWLNCLQEEICTVISAAAITLHKSGTHDLLDAIRFLINAIFPVTVARGGTNKSSFNPGSVVFAGAGGSSLTEDPGQFYWDAVNNRLGLGTNAPNANLHVVGTGHFTAGLTADAGATITGNTHTSSAVIDGTCSVGSTMHSVGDMNTSAQLSCATFRSFGAATCDTTLHANGDMSAGGNLAGATLRSFGAAVLDTTLDVTGGISGHAGAVITGNVRSSTMTSDSTIAAGSSVSAVTDVICSNGSMHQTSTAANQGYAATGPSPLLELVSTATGNTFVLQNNAANTLTISFNLTGIASISSAGAYTQTSDESLKEDFEEMTGALDLVDRLRPGRYRWKASGETDIGFIAQEVRQVVPEVVTETKDDLLGVAYGNLGTVAIAAIKELIAENRGLRARLDAAGI